MSYQKSQIPHVLDVLGDPTRRQILELLRDRPRPVGEVADELPVSRPAVSRHLRLLKEAGLVADEAEGTRRIYRLRPEGFEGVVAYWDQFWGQALAALKQHIEAGGEMSETTLIIRKELPIRATRAETFRVFTEEMAAWWPFEGRQLLDGRKEAVVIEPFPGGRLYERTVDGQEAEWGSVVEYEPPDRLVLRWHPGYGEERATTITVEFEAIGTSLTRIVLVHEGWEVHGADAAAISDGYTSGWDTVLEGLAEYFVR